MARRHGLNRLINDGNDGVPKGRLRCACGNPTFRYRMGGNETLGLYLPTSAGPITQILADGTYPPLDSHVLCTACGLEYSRDCPWDPS